MKVLPSKALNTYLRDIYCPKCKVKTQHQISDLVRGQVRTCYTCRKITHLKGGR
jgi:ribosomal protein L44E